MKVFTESGKKITIVDKNEIKRGGEGKILTIPEIPDQVAKIYLNSNYQHMSLVQKNALSVLDEKYFVKPLELIYQKKAKKDILGFTMEYLQADFVPLAALFNKNFCVSNNIDSDFKNSIAETIIEAVTHAHQKDIVIGDLSGLNILVDMQGNVKFIDVDSYETPVHSHWGLLLDEIRDYIYQGKVSKESDYFAMAVILFNLFTHLHPFKGIHKQYRGIAERMLQKIPVFKQDPQLIIPKCYTPIQESDLQEQFNEIFANGKRFLLRLRKPILAKAFSTPITSITQDQLILKEIYKLNNKEFFQKAYFTDNRGLITTNQQFLIIDTSSKGIAPVKKQIYKADFQDIFVGEKNTVALKNRQLYTLQDDQSWQILTNIGEGIEQGTYQQINNILVWLSGSYMRFLFLDEITQSIIRVEQTPVFVPAFDIFAGLIQNVGGVQYIFYKSGKTISTVKANKLLKNVRISGNIGIASYEEKQNSETQIKYEYFSIQNLQTKFSNAFINNFKSFAYKAQNAEKGIIFEPEDDILRIRNPQDFKILQEMNCNTLSTESQLFAPQAGIVALEANFCYLINTK